MDKVFRTAVTTAAIGMAALFLSPPSQAGNGSAVGAGLVGFGIGAILGSMMGPPDVYFVPPPPPEYYGPAAYGPHYYYRPGAYGPPPRAPNWYGERSYQRPAPPPPAAAHQYRPAPTRSATATAKTGPATAKTKPVTAPVKQDADAKFKAVQAKAKRDGVETLTQKDIEGLTPGQITQLRGY
ncbi:hypothetical protein [Methyloceanibacter sp.]|uniref:hypothetical protein n=1 Tax=Methyloceanibacter sp. TaxID=1965321 RepID=UPI003D6C81AF